LTICKFPAIIILRRLFVHIFISTFERAVCDAIALLTRTRFHKSAPLYLVKPQSQLVVTLLELDANSAVAEVGCRNWGGDTVVTLSFYRVGDGSPWSAWGPFSIRYGRDYPVASLCTKVVDTKEIYPMYAHRPDAMRHQELHVRCRDGILGPPGTNQVCRTR
jgi:hypothetical protein